MANGSPGPLFQPSPSYLKASPLHGTGTFAFTALSSRTPIVKEEALWTLSSDEFKDDHAFLTSFTKLPDDVTDAILVMDGGFKSADEAWLALEREQMADQAVILRGIFMRNGQTYGDRYALYRNIARVNHSCRPNAQVIDDEDSSSAVLVAIRDIPRDDEIMIKYCPSSLHTFHERRTLLQRFEIQACNCSLCTLPKHQRDQSDARLRLLQQGADVLQDFTDRLEKPTPAPDPTPPASSTEPAGDREQYGHADRGADLTQYATSALAKAKEMERLVAQEQLVGVELVVIAHAGFCAADYLGAETDAEYFGTRLQQAMRQIGAGSRGRSEPGGEGSSVEGEVSRSS